MWYLASAKTTPFSVVWSALSTNSQAAPVVVTATPEVEGSNIDDSSEENISLEEVSEAEDQISENNSDNSEENN